MQTTSTSSAFKKSTNNAAIQSEHAGHHFDWQALINQWQASDVSQKEFCRLKSLAYTSFIYQIAKFKKKKKTSPQLLPVKLIQANPYPASNSDANHFLIQWPNGTKLSIPQNADAVILKMLLTCLRES